MRWLAILLLVPLIHAGDAGGKLVILGDSLTAGFGLDEDEAYPALLGKALASDGWTVVNAGLSGDTSAGALRRVPWLLKGRPTVALVAIGANDGLRGIKPETTRANLDAIVGAFKAAKVRVVIAGMLLPVNFGEDYRTAFAAVFPAVAEHHDLPLIPFLLEGVAAQSHLNLADGIHPNAKGHQRIATLVLGHLRPVLESQ